MVMMMMMEVWKNSVIMYGVLITYALQEKKNAYHGILQKNFPYFLKNWIVLGVFKMKGTYDIHMSSTYY